ncbi:MAG: 3-hydroxyacyl-CoA dehydrogenase family protein [Halobacteriales archaeon]|nr:3-hydroxyacyl-CoA dehydrogenase family protein [Halobacteriales archaeon]
MERVAVLGAGQMGHGIAHVSALAGHSVVLRDVKDEFVQKGLASIRKNLDKGVELGKVKGEDRDTALGRIRGTTDLEEAAREASVVIEAIPEDLALKRATFAELDRMAPSGALLCSNTSSIRIAEIAHGLGQPKRVLGMHFFNPVHLMPLVEVIHHPGTGPRELERALGFARGLGKEAIVVKDSPGFATSRLGVALGLEAMRMLEEGVASASDIDKAMELGYKHPMGPLKLSDLVGLDTRLHIAEYLFAQSGREVFRPPEVLRAKVREGKLGKKTGEGFHAWPKE